MSTKIEWADEVWNPVTGCTKVSAGCKNCYAERMAKRLGGRFGYPPAPDQFKVTPHPELLDKPLRWKRPRRVFVNSMSDLFHEDVLENFIVQIFITMSMSRRHTYLILTKRPERMLQFVVRWVDAHKSPLPNVWLGVSVENQQVAQDRIPWLLATPAAVHFLSVEPMLERIDLSSVLLFDGDTLGKSLFDRGNGNQIDWVIAGCESGQKARPSPPYIDVRYLKDQCVEANVPFFLKQMWGKKMPELDGRQWTEYPTSPMKTEE